MFIATSKLGITEEELRNFPLSGSVISIKPLGMGVNQ
jgi:hypothetical protein